MVNSIVIIRNVSLLEYRLFEDAHNVCVCARWNEMLFLSLSLVTLDVLHTNDFFFGLDFSFLDNLELIDDGFLSRDPRSVTEHSLRSLTRFSLF